MGVLDKILDIQAIVKNFLTVLKGFVLLLELILRIPKLSIAATIIFFQKLLKPQLGVFLLDLIPFKVKILFAQDRLLDHFFNIIISVIGIIEQDSDSNHPFRARGYRCEQVALFYIASFDFDFLVP